MHRQSNRYTFMFALAVCVICSLALSIVSEGLKSRQELNVVLDIKKNILKVVDLRDPLPAHPRAETVLDVYNEKIEEMVIDAKGDVVEGRRPEEIQEGEALYSLYVYKEDGRTLAYCFPVTGKGLWGPIHGYLAVEPDAVTVRGVTFYVTPDFKETPGLGAEIVNAWFQDNFKGKKIWDFKTNQLTPVAVVKGKVRDVVPAEKAQFYVDGISGATMTTKGVTATMDKWLNIYEPFLQKIRQL